MHSEVCGVTVPTAVTTSKTPPNWEPELTESGLSVSATLDKKTQLLATAANAHYCD